MIVLSLPKRREFLHRLAAAVSSGLYLGCGSSPSLPADTADSDADASTGHTDPRTRTEIDDTTGSPSSPTCIEAFPAGEAYFEAAIEHARELGLAYLEAFSVTDAEVMAVVELVLDAADPADALDILEEAVANDFRTLGIQTLAGWTCSQTELLLCAALALICR